MSQKDETRTDRWIANAMGWNDRVLHGYGGANVFYEGDRIYSYGHHFEMGRVLRTAKGEPRAILLNGERYSHTTTRHQAAVRSAAAGSGLPTLIVPYAALRAAQIELDTVEPIHIREDRNETLHHSRPEVFGAHVLMDDPNGEEEPYEQRVWVGSNHPEADDDGSGFKTETRTRVKKVPDPNRRAVRAGDTWPIAEFDPHTNEWHWTTTRHWLGDSLFIARAKGRRRRFLSSFDYQESTPLYFLCEMPRTSDACTVEQAYEDLKPESVKQAEEAGLEVTRQGDVFAIPTELTTREVKLMTPHRKGRIVKRPRGGLIGTNHTASEVLFCTKGRTYARGVMYHDPGELRAPDHKRQKMGDGKTWHLLVKNTVPVEKPQTRTREAV